MRAALALWRGPALADVAGEPFAQGEIARLEEQRLEVLEARIDADLAAGRHRELVAELQELTARHRLREHLHGQLMLALYRCERQADALAAYRHARALLSDELGLEPGRALRELERAILTQDKALDARSPVNADELIEDAPIPELAALGGVLEAAAAGSGGALLIEGEAGIGKTRLLAAAHARAADLGLRVLSATADEVEAEVPLAVARLLFATRWHPCCSRQFPSLSSDILTCRAVFPRITTPATCSGPLIARSGKPKTANFP